MSTSAAARIEYVPGETIRTVATPNPGDWVTLGVPYSWNRSRGRDDVFAEMDSATVTIEMPDRDGALFAAGLLPPGTGALPPFTPIRVVVTVDGTDHVRFTGFVVKPPTPAGKGRARTAVIVAADWLGAASLFNFPGSLWATWCAGSNPRLWWRDNATSPSLNPVRGDHIFNEGTETGGDGYSLDDPTNTVTTMDSTQLVTGDDSRSWLVQRKVSTDGSIQWANTVTTSFVMHIWIQINATPSSAFDLVWGSSERFGAADRWKIRVNTDGSITGSAWTLGGSLSATATVSGDHCDDSPHLIRLSWDDTLGFRVITDLGSATVAPSFATPYANGYVVVCDASASSSTVLWSNLVIAPFMGESTATWVTSPTLFSNQSLSDRIDSLCNAAGLPAPDLDLNMIETITYGGLSSFSGSLGAAISDMASDFLGTAIVTRSGDLRIRDAAALDDEFDPGQYVDHVASLTDNPFAPDLPDAATGYARLAGTFKAGAKLAAPPQLPVVRYKPDGDIGPRWDRIINVLRIEGSDGGVLTWRDQTSIDQWGERPKDLTVGFSAASSWVRSAAKKLVAGNAAPKNEASKITVQPVTAEAAAFVLAVDLEDPIHFHATDPTGSDVLIDGTWRIQSEAEEWDGVTWSASYAIAEA